MIWVQRKLDFIMVTCSRYIMYDITGSPEFQLLVSMIADLGYRGLLTPRQVRLTSCKASRRYQHEGMGFLTKTLPMLGKALDKGLLCRELTIPAPFEKEPGTQLPKFLGELFNRVFDEHGKIRSIVDVRCVRVLRELTYLFYKYEIPHSSRAEKACLDKFRTCEAELALTKELDPAKETMARNLLRLLLADFDPYDIYPRHGPGAVADGLRHEAKFRFDVVPLSLASVYGPEYFAASFTDVADRFAGDKILLKGFANELNVVQSARVILVPKDSRGPRIISCEPAVYQWIQQGLMRAIVPWIEEHPLTRGRVNFTDQSINGRLALEGSKTLRGWATLDLAEASDRVSLTLFRKIFPEHIVTAFESCRSGRTSLPDGSIVELGKFAPMGSALCFPVLALTCWAALKSHHIDDVYVYGDDVIVPSAQAHLAISALEAFGLKVNRDKSCFTGLFRESCGVDAYHGNDVTPVRIRTPWSSTDPRAYVSWISYANSLYIRGYTVTARKLAAIITHQWGPVVQDESSLTAAPHFVFTDPQLPTPKRRYNYAFQRYEYRILDVAAESQPRPMSGHDRLLRYLSEAGRGGQKSDCGRLPADAGFQRGLNNPTAAWKHTNVYTSRDVIKFKSRWI